MPPKGKGKPDGKGKGKPKKGNLEEEARLKAEAVDDIDDEDYKKSLRKECRELEEKIRKEEDLAGLY
jgi:hypothetical protein